MRPPAVLASLLLGGAALMPRAAAAEPADAPAWVVDPARPGDSLPPAGGSLFDALFAEARAGGSVHRLPFPFEALLARVDAQLAGGPMRRVLIPLGRSLQRTAAGPEAFGFPRYLAAVDAEPAPGAPLLKDRLYIGYQEKAAVLEVISYNEASGRFEFQLVKDYRAGGRPQVFYANRHVCFACHQNGAPIFSRALWDETNANPAIAAQLAAEGRAFHGFAAVRGVDTPYAIDVGVRRANRFALTQHLWREGCGGGEAGLRCRAGLFAAALRLRLADGHVPPPDAAFDATVAQPLQAAAARQWPGGLAVGRSDIPNRNPLQGLDAWPEVPAARVARSHVAARFDPLVPRPADTVWRADAPGALAEAVAGVADFARGGEWQAFDSALARQGRRLARAEWLFECAPLPASRASRCRGIGVAGGVSLRFEPAGRIEGFAAAASAPRAAIVLRPLGPGRWQPAEALRLPGGDGLDEVDARGLAGGRGRLRWVLRADSQALAGAMDRLLADTAGRALFDGRPIPRADIFAALLAALGAPPVPRPAQPWPEARLESAPGPGQGSATPGALAGFHTWCAACHLSADSVPPNFLAGPAEQLEARIRQCAPRIYVRLAMARLPAAARDKTPMPPDTLLPALGSDAARWAAGPERAALEAAVAAMLQSETGRAPDPETLLAGGYEALRPCLAQR